MKNLFSTFAILILFASQSFSQHSLQGVWEGGITVPGGQLKIVFKITETENGYTGTLDIPQQGAKGLSLDPITQTGDSVSLNFKAGQVTGLFTGTFVSPTKIIGSYSQGGPSTPFSIVRTSATINNSSKADNEISLLITNGDIDIGGTLTLPEGNIKAPLFIMNSGSGAQDRDSNVFGFKIFEVIAQHLAKNGIPSFRFDDRGINQSSGEFSNARLQDLTSDVEAIISYFQNSTDYTFRKFGLLGHSQGGVVAGKVASENKAVSELILMGSTAPSLSEILRYQVEFAYSASPINKALVEKEIRARESIMNAVVRGTELNNAKESYIKAYTEVLNNLPEAQRNSIPDMNAMVSSQTEQLAALYSSPQIKSLLFYVPTKDLEKLTIPTLVLFGDNDTQVTISQNQAKIRTALETSGTGYTIKVIETANHLFQKSNTGLASEYPTLDRKFVGGFLEYISSWILDN